MLYPLNKYEKLKEIAELDRVYVDESGINKYLQREHARAKAGTPVYGVTSGLRYARESFIAAKLQSCILAPFCYAGTCDTELFNVWLKEFLIVSNSLQQLAKEYDAAIQEIAILKQVQDSSQVR